MVSIVQVSQPEAAYLKKLETEFLVATGSLDGLGPEAILVHISRVSSSRKNTVEEPDKLINYLIKHAHWSPFEHTYITFEIRTSRAIGRQILRHRSLTFQEFSQRYQICPSFEDIEFRLQADDNRQSSTEPVAVLSQMGITTRKDFADITDDQKVAIVEAHDLLKKTRKVYDNLIDAGISRETARMILPECTTTRMYATGPIRSFIHLFDVRDDEHAQLEVQKIARQMKKAFIERFPVVSEALGYVTPNQNK